MQSSLPGQLFESGGIGFELMNIGIGIHLITYGITALYCVVFGPGTIISTIAIFLRYCMLLFWGPCGTCRKEREDWELEGYV